MGILSSCRRSTKSNSDAGLRLVASELPLSAIYHQVKWALPRGSGLLVAPLSDFPKFKLMSPGALGGLALIPVSDCYSNWMIWISVIFRNGRTLMSVLF